MKRLMLATAMTTAFAASAFAANTVAESEISRFAPNVNFAALNESDVLALSGIIHGSGTFSERQSQVVSILLAEEAMQEDAQMTETSIYYMTDDQYQVFESELSRFGPDIEVEMLDNDTRLALMAVVYGSGSFSERQGQVDSIMLNR